MTIFLFWSWFACVIAILDKSFYVLRIDYLLGGDQEEGNVGDENLRVPGGHHSQARLVIRKQGRLAIKPD